MDLRDERERDCLLYYCKGLLVMLNECCTGRNTHLVANLQTSLRIWVNILETRATSEAVAKIKGLLPRVAERVRAEYSAHWERKRRWTK